MRAVVSCCCCQARVALERDLVNDEKRLLFPHTSVSARASSTAAPRAQSGSEPLIVYMVNFSSRLSNLLLCELMIVLIVEIFWQPGAAESAEIESRLAATQASQPAGYIFLPSLAADAGGEILSVVNDSVILVYVSISTE